MNEPSACDCAPATICPSCKVSTVIFTPVSSVLFAPRIVPLMLFASKEMMYKESVMKAKTLFIKVFG